MIENEFFRKLISIFEGLFVRRTVGRAKRKIGRAIKAFVIIFGIVAALFALSYLKAVIYEEDVSNWSVGNEISKTKESIDVLIGKKSPFDAIDLTKEQNTEKSVAAGTKTEEKADAKEGIIDKAKNVLGIGKGSVHYGKAVPSYGSSGKLYVHFIDVGQGDACLIEKGEDTILIDTGEYEMYDALKAYLNAHGITQIDYFIGTHPHSDHIGSAASLVREFSPKAVYIIDKPFDTFANEIMLEAIAETGVPMNVIEAGNRIELNDLTLNVVAPRRGAVFVSEDGEENINNYSAVLKLSFGDKSFLFAADAEQDEEQDILAGDYNIKADVIKVGHHGSMTASTEAFVTAVSPEFAVISCGVGNEYGHPHDRSLKTYKAHGATVLRTDELGSIVAVTNGKTLEFYTEKGDGK